jgi:DNA-binding PadR family transcriptional regulator
LLSSLDYYVVRSSIGTVTQGRKARGKGLNRANEPSVLILTSLAGGEKHGYALAQDIEEFAGVTLGPGTLYGAITRLEERGLIQAAAGDDRRRPYRISAAGRQALSVAVRDMRTIADEGAARLGLALASPHPRSGWIS